LSRSKVYALMSSGRLRSVKIDGARRLRAVDLAEYVESLSVRVPDVGWGDDAATVDGGRDLIGSGLAVSGRAHSIRPVEPTVSSPTPVMSSGVPR
jgi:hypothetical protein